MRNTFGFSPRRNGWLFEYRPCVLRKGFLIAVVASAKAGADLWTECEVLENVQEYRGQEGRRGRHQAEV